MEIQSEGKLVYLIMVASGSGVLWFMHLLWVYCVILVLIRKIEKGKLLAAGSKTPLCHHFTDSVFQMGSAWN